MGSYVKNESHPGDVSQSHAAISQDAGNGSSDDGHANRGPEPRESELKAAVSIATAQFGHDLHALGSELLNIESRHGALMERLQRIAEQVDERALRQFETLREEVTGAHRQNLSLREDLEVLQKSFPEQLEMIGGQYANLNQQFQTAEHRLGGIEHRLRDAVDRLQMAEGQHDAVQQRLRPAEQKILEAEQNWQRTDAQFQVTDQRFKEIEQQINIAEQRIQTAENNHNAMQQQLQAAEQRIQAAETKHDAMEQMLQAADQAIQTAENKHGVMEQMLQAAEQRIQTAETRHDAMEQMLQAAEQRIQAAETKHNVMEQMLQAAEQKILETERKLADADRENKTFATQMKTRAERLTAQWEEIKRAHDEHATRRENVEISIGTIGQDVGQLKEQVAELLTGPYERLKNIQITLKSYRRILVISVIAFILTLLMAGYMKLGRPGWPILAPYLSQWIPG
jgi:chromosome segregation ATPase